MTSFDTMSKSRNNPTNPSSSTTRQASPRPGTSTTPVSPDRIARRAYEIWERSGRPDGQSDQHWYQAEQELRRS